MDVAVAHVLGTACGVIGVEFVGGLLLLVVGEVEHDDVRLLSANHVKAVLVWLLDKVVVGIDKLYVLAGGHAQARVSCGAQPAVALAYVDDVVGILL